MENDGQVMIQTATAFRIMNRNKPIGVKDGKRIWEAITEKDRWRNEKPIRKFDFLSFLKDSPGRFMDNSIQYLSVVFLF